MEMNEPSTENENENDNIEEWTTEQLRKRSQELQLIDENGHCILSPTNERASIVDLSEESGTLGRDSVLEIENGSKSASTTSDSQITVRSSPIAKKIDKISMCRHCHKNCKQKNNKTKTSSLKVQHSQSSLNRCCQSNGSSQGSQISSSNSRTSINSKSKLINDDDAHSSPSSTKTITTNTCSNVPCMCRCSSKDFNANRMPQEMKKETCKIYRDVSEVSLNKRIHEIPIRESKITTTNDDDKLIGISNFHPITNDPFNAVPKISILPPTPDGLGSSTTMKTNSSTWNADKEQNEISPDDSPQEELPYQVLNTSLKRYGTLSSLEKLPSDETEDRTYDSSEAEANDDDGMYLYARVDSIKLFV